MPPYAATLRSHLPSATSPLLDAGNPNGCRDPEADVITFDQRGLARTQDGPDPDLIARCDIGAVEVQSVEAPPNEIFADGFE